jgi:hypothetical protein
MYQHPHCRLRSCKDRGENRYGRVFGSAIQVNVIHLCLVINAVAGSLSLKHLKNIDDCVRSGGESIYTTLDPLF